MNEWQLLKQIQYLARLATWEDTGLVWGILILVVVLIIAYPLTRMYVDNQYQRRLKKMGYGPTAPPAPPPAAAPMPPGQQAQKLKRRKGNM